ncbi:MAG: 16S rRNA (cytidine(1402)-2'-O)-methyltransferase [Candidatus Paceibacterota bacterium]
MSILYIVGTPIGNLEDITLRAIRVLGEADLILCEDTRVTRNLLDRHGIKRPMLSYHAHSKLSRVDEVIAMLREGKTLALVSDAGTPGISDPGSELVRAVRAECQTEIESGEIKIESVPGPSALAAAISIAGVSGGDFLFLGFLPHKKGRETLFREIAASERNVIFYESPHRIMKTLISLRKYLGESGNVHVCRELTKIFEQVVSGSPEKVISYFEKNDDKLRGEIVVIVTK